MSPNLQPVVKRLRFPIEPVEAENRRTRKEQGLSACFKDVLCAVDEIILLIHLLTLLSQHNRLIIISMSCDYSSHCSTLYSILRHYNRSGELQRLIRWAKYKQLERPLRLYRSRLEDEELRLNRHQLHYPHVARVAYIIHLVNRVCFPSTRYPKRGSAQGYTRRALFANSSSLSDS